MKRALKPAFFVAALCLCGYSQETPAPATPAQENSANQTKGLPPRTAPTEYLSQMKAGSVTIGAEFKGHSIPTMQGTLSTEDYVVVELGLFGAPEARLKLSIEDFSLRMNGKKAPLSSQPYGLVLGSVKDPEWVPEEPVEKKGKGGGLSTGGQGGGGGDNTPPPPPKMPFPLKRAMEQKVQKSSLAEGDRPLPQAGLLFFSYRGNQKGIHSVELMYNGPAGKATMALQP